MIGTDVTGGIMAWPGRPGARPGGVGAPADHDCEDDQTPAVTVAAAADSDS